MSGRAGELRIATFNLENLGGSAPDRGAERSADRGAEFDRRIAALRPRLDALDADPHARICVAGDCNAGGREMPLRVLRADPDDVEAPELAWRSLSALDDRIPAARRHTLLHGGRRLMLDHLLASQALARSCRRIAVHNDDLPDEVAAAGQPPLHSFHAPLVAAFAADPGSEP